MRHLRVAFTPRLLAPWLSMVVVACSSESLSPGGGSEHAMDPTLDAARAVAESVLGQAGEVATLRTIYDPSYDGSGRPLYPTAFAWNPTADDELWITLREPPSNQECDNGTTVACTWLMGRVAIVTGATLAPEEEPKVVIKMDANAWHFMRRPTSIAWGEKDSFATCAEARTSNYEDESIPFNGPVLWSADPAIFGAPPPPKSPTGSTHIDMLHESPYCMGIAHERDNVYWTFNGDAGSLDRYDFHAPHEPGGDDHTDGELWRYAMGSLARLPDVPSHLVLDPATGLLYVADTGHGRIVALDTTTGRADGDVVEYDGIATHALMTDAVLSPVVPPGLLSQPTGLALYRGVLFVTDFATGTIAAFDTSGRRVASRDTYLTDALGGIGVGPDGRAYFTDRSTGRVLRYETPSNSE
ncbi:MAG TPA: hypothetical protein VGQ57_11600 [Polyangiaceae bacterium]|nr:hypothetical protein [Polyangiaceae bacterium]